MLHSLKLDQRLHMVREEVRTMTQDKERGEQVWRGRLHRCQRQLKAKEEEMSRQSQYFENFKAQLQHKLSLAQDREHNLQNRIYTLEKQLLDMRVSAATGIATISAARIAAGTVTHWEEQRLPPMRGEGEGEEERKEERRRNWQPSVENEREGEKEIQGGRIKDTNSNEARLQGLILSLREDLRVLLEREEGGMTERRGLMEQLQKAQENSHFLGCKVEEMKAKVHQLKLSEDSLMEEVEELKEENHRLQQILLDPARQAASQSSTVLESTCPSPGSNTLSYATAMGCSSVESSGKIHLTSAEETGQLHLSDVPPVHHQAAAESMQRNTEGDASSAKSETSKNFCHLGPSLQSLSLTTETIDEFKLGTWCARGILNPEKSPSVESDALREAYRSLGFGEDLEALQEQRDRLEVSLQDTQEQLQITTQENTRLKLQLSGVEQGSSREKINTLTTCGSAEDNSILPLAQDGLVQALNQENQALADRIQEFLAHIELREEEIKREQAQLREHISKQEADRVRLEQENQDQECLITELTKKTEDDLNTIMELQQRLVESERCVEESQVDKKPCGSQLQSEYTATSTGCFQRNNQEECVDSLVESMLRGVEFSQQPDGVSATLAPSSQRDHHHDPLQNSRQSSLHVSSPNDQVVQLTKSVQSLQTEEEELSGSINTLREQHREVALSVQTQTDVKQQLTRTVWRLKEEKDGISRSLAGLSQEREQLSRTVCGLKDERDQFMRFISGLKEERESLSALERDQKKLLEESAQIMQSIQSLRTESDQLNQAVLHLKRERDELTDSLKCLKEQRDEGQSSHASREDGDELIKSSLREDKESIEHSISILKQEEKQIKLLLQGLREERSSLQAALPSQTLTEWGDQKQHLLNPNSAIRTKKTETVVGTGATQRSSAQEQSYLLREIEALTAELKRSRDELDESHADNKRLLSEWCQSEAGREEAERKAAQAADNMVVSLTDVADQMEEIRKENDGLTTQVKLLQGKLAGLVREKTDALSLKAHIEEQCNIITAQLKAKTVALEELNSEYIALKRGQDSKADLSAVISLRTRYNDIRAKYDALLKKRSQNDLEIAPLKAKLSCLVVKCQERNGLLVQMMKAMHRCGCVDPTLTQQVEQLLSDAALQDYIAAFTPASNVKTQDYTTGFTSGFISTFRDYTGGFTPDQTCSARFTPESGELKSENVTSLVTTESTTNSQNCRGEVTPAPTATPEKNAHSPVPTSPVQEHAGVQAPPSPVVPALQESFIPNTAQVSPSASGPKKLAFHRSDTKGKSSPDTTRSTGSSLSPSPGRRLSSPEKIVNLHEQLQKTLMSSYQAPVSRGRGQQPRKSLSFSAPADLRPASQTKKQSLSSNTLHTDSLPVTAAASQAKHTPAAMAKNKSTTLLDAVASRSANVTFSPDMFTNHRYKSDTSKTAALSSSSKFSFASVSPCKAKSTTSCGTNITTSLKLANKIPATRDKSDTEHTPSAPFTLRTFDSISSDTNPKTTASETTAPSTSTATEANHFNMPSKTDGAAPAYHGLVLTASCAPPAQCSPETFNKSARKSTAAGEKAKTARPKSEAPAEVRAVEVIETVGQSGLMIGWERPPLDELGCSNGTFVYGYRVFVDGDFHKSVMSSACTKCILENVDLSVPVNISVQTLGSNGLSSNFVHTMYMTSVRGGHH